MIEALGYILLVFIVLLLCYRSDVRNIRDQRCLDCGKPIQELQEDGTTHFKRYCVCEWKVYPRKRGKLKC